jgi:predicted metal-dependent phosphoesterase TrpH
MNAIHRECTGGRWNTLTCCEQLANVGSEIERAIRWKRKGNSRYMNLAFDRALELLDLTIADAKNRRRLRELVRTREALADYFVFENSYNSSDKIWRNYFNGFAYAARLLAGK